MAYRRSLTFQNVLGIVVLVFRSEHETIKQNSVNIHTFIKYIFKKIDRYFIYPPGNSG